MDSICKCGRPASAHCPDCGACPHNECPYWCAANDDPYKPSKITRRKGVSYR